MVLGVMRIIAATALVVSATGALAQGHAPYPVKDCSRLTTRMERNQCAGANLQSADAALNRLYEQTSCSIRNL